MTFEFANDEIWGDERIMKRIGNLSVHMATNGDSDRLRQITRELIHLTFERDRRIEDIANARVDE